MAEVSIVGELVQVRMLRAVSGYGRRGTMVEVGLDVAAGLMENRLAEFVAVTGFVAEEVGADASTGEVEPGRGKGARHGRRKARGGGGDTADAEPGEGADAG